MLALATLALLLSQTIVGVKGKSLSAKSLESERNFPHSQDYYAGYVKAIADNFDQIFAGEKGIETGEASQRQDISNTKATSEKQDESKKGEAAAVEGASDNKSNATATPSSASKVDNSGVANATKVEDKSSAASESKDNGYNDVPTVTVGQAKEAKNQSVSSPSNAKASDEAPSNAGKGDTTSSVNAMTNLTATPDVSKDKNGNVADVNTASKTSGEATVSKAGDGATSNVAKEKDEKVLDVNTASKVGDPSTSDVTKEKSEKVTKGNEISKEKGAQDGKLVGKNATVPNAQHQSSIVASSTDEAGLIANNAAPQHYIEDAAPSKGDSTATKSQESAHSATGVGISQPEQGQAKSNNTVGADQSIANQTVGSETGKEQPKEAEKGTNTAQASPQEASQKEVNLQNPQTDSSSTAANGTVATPMKAVAEGDQVLRNSVAKATSEDTFRRTLVKEQLAKEKIKNPETKQDIKLYEGDEKKEEIRKRQSEDTDDPDDGESDEAIPQMTKRGSEISKTPPKVKPEMPSTSNTALHNKTQGATKTSPKVSKAQEKASRKGALYVDPGVRDAFFNLQEEGSPEPDSRQYVLEHSWGGMPSFVNSIMPFPQGFFQPRYNPYMGDMYGGGGFSEYMPMGNPFGYGQQPFVGMRNAMYAPQVVSPAMYQNAEKRGSPGGSKEDNHEHQSNKRHPYQVLMIPGGYGFPPGMMYTYPQGNQAPCGTEFKPGKSSMLSTRSEQREDNETGEDKDNEGGEDDDELSKNKNRGGCECLFGGHGIVGFGWGWPWVG